MDKPGFNFSVGPTFLVPRVQEELHKLRRERLFAL